MRATLLIGPAGSGKTFRCNAEAREALRKNPEGSPLLFVAPKQATYQLERQLLADNSLSGYTRLRILSFERLAEFVLEELQQPALRLLSEQGRIMVLRALLTKKTSALKLFHGSARLVGFAQQLNEVLRELQRQQLTPEKLRALAERFPEPLCLKFQDFATMLDEYYRWLQSHELEDADRLLDKAVHALHSNTNPPANGLCIDQLWLDGFAEISEQELNLLAALLPHCKKATLTFCLDEIPRHNISWLSNWALMRRTFEECKARLDALPDCQTDFELLPRSQTKTRFQNGTLATLEESWPTSARSDQDLDGRVRIVSCPDPEGEAMFAAREILAHVRQGCRFRDLMVLVRSLESYHPDFERVFRRYEIPFFIDRREPVTHHPLTELTRGALRCVALGSPHEDWFAVLKSGLTPVCESDVDRLENESLARGWSGEFWQKEISLPNEPELAGWAEKLRRKIVPQFQKFELTLRGHSPNPTGKTLAQALRQLWADLDVEAQLRKRAEAAAESPSDISNSIHLTVWQQMIEWLENVELGFGAEALSLREWLAIVDAGLGSFTVGVIPPALDQVVIGSIDRSRNPDVKVAFVVGLNESVFPAPPDSGPLLTQNDREALENANIRFAGTLKQQLGRERFYAYVALTRARENLVCTFANADADGKLLNRSPFLSQLQRIFPSLQIEHFSPSADWRTTRHANELTSALLSECATGTAQWRESVTLPPLVSLLERLNAFSARDENASLGSELARKLYGPVLKTSVSRLEQFAMCPFRFFVHSGLRAQERKLFELDSREQGSFQHDVLKFFHLQLQNEKRRWRDLTPEEARERVGKIARGMLSEYRGGLLDVSDESRFKARAMTESLQDFVETLVTWMREQYKFDPVAAELPFGQEEVPPWEVPLSDGVKLALHGRIDRVDVCATSEEEAFCAVIDYKSSAKKLDPIFIEHGIQLQLFAYLNVVRRWREPKQFFGAKTLVPAGVFYVSLRGQYERGENRNDALAESGRARKLAYRHCGRFDAAALRCFDGVNTTGDQFNFRLRNDGGIHGACKEPLSPGQLTTLLDQVEKKIAELGDRILSGDVRIDPYKKGSVTPCTYCDYTAICRIDTWTHVFRNLERAEQEP